MFCQREFVSWRIQGHYFGGLCVVIWFDCLVDYVRKYDLKREGGELFKRDFANFKGIMKINVELQRKESRKQIPKTVLRWYQNNNRLFCRNNRLFLSAVYKNNLKTKFKELRVRDKHASNLYWFTLTPRATSSPQKPLSIPLCNQNQITHTTHQSSDLEPLKKHTTFCKPHQECWSLTPQEHTTLLGNTTTEIQ